MKLKTIFLVIVLFFVILVPSCKKDIHAVLVITIENSEIDYLFYSISYDVKLTETEGKDCIVVSEECSVIDGDGNVLYSRSYPSSITIAGNGTFTKSYSGFLIGIYMWDPKPVKLRHTFQYTDSASGNTYTAYGELTIHSL